MLPWIEKHRPVVLSDIVAQGQLPSTLQSLVDAHRMPHLLLHGPPGTGKTSAALAIAKSLHKDKATAMTLELNASDARGIAVVRDKIKSFASTQQIFQAGVKLIILDEADAMTSAAHFALRRSKIRELEKYTKLLLI